MTKPSAKYTMVYGPLVYIDFDEHGNVRDYRLEWSERGADWVVDNETGTRHLVSDIPQDVTDRVDDFLGIIDLVRWFVPEPTPDEPF